MNILIINYEFPPLGGGAGNASYHIAKNMSKEGHSIVILTSHFKDLLYEEVLEERLTIIRLPVSRKKTEASSISELFLFALKSIYHVNRIAKRFKIDKSIAFFTIPSGIACLFLKYLYNIPYLVSLRGADVPGFIERKIAFYHALLKPLTKLIWKKSAKVIANSEGLKELALKTLSTSDIKVIPNGVDCSFYLPKSDNKLRTDKAKVNLLFVGRFSKQKGLETLISLMQLLQNKLNYHLSLIGDGPDKVAFENKIKEEQLDSFCSFEGWLSKNDLKEAYRNADIFTFPSLCEGMPNVILEAMASGLAILASNISGNNELVIDKANGFLYPLGNTAYLADKIIQVSKNPAMLMSMKQKSREIALKEYSWTNTSKSYISLLEIVDNAK